MRGEGEVEAECQVHDEVGGGLGCRWWLHSELDLMKGREPRSGGDICVRLVDQL